MQVVTHTSRELKSGFHRHLCSRHPLPLAMSDYPSLDNVFSQDPNLPSIAFQAHEYSPIYIPWTKRVVALGIGLDSSVVSEGRNETAFRPSAFSCEQGNATYQLDTGENTSSLRQASSSHAATSYEHMDMKGSVSVGGSMLGVSGRGAFSKSVQDNRDVRLWLLRNVSLKLT